MFSKIPQNFIKPECNAWEDFKDNVLYSHYQSGTTLLEYYGIRNIEQFKKQHIRRPFTISPSIVRFTQLTGKGILHPHKDHDALAVLNYYISAGDDVTIFYTAPNDSAPVIYPGKKQANIYNQNDLTEVARFTADSNDAFLLDVSNIHSVIKSNSAPRLFISYIWKDHTYEEILENIKNG